MATEPCAGLEFGIEPAYVGVPLTASAPLSDSNDRVESVIGTDLLEVRPSRKPDGRYEACAMLKLCQELSHRPEQFFSRLVLAAKELSHADSGGISLLNEAEDCFVWPSIAGGLSPHVQEGLAPITPPLEEVLLVPFHVKGRAVGTIWAVIHTLERKFDKEDRRLLESLSVFAAAAYETLTGAGLIERYLKGKVAPAAR